MRYEKVVQEEETRKKHEQNTKKLSIVDSIPFNQTGEPDWRTMQVEPQKTKFFTTGFLRLVSYVVSYVVSALVSCKKTNVVSCNIKIINLKRERMVEKRQWTSEKRRKDSHKYRGIPKNPEITVAQNAGEFKKREEEIVCDERRRIVCVEEDEKKENIYFLGI